MKWPIDPLERAGQILTGLQKGALLTVSAQGKTNTMTIAWGTLGVVWGKPMFIAYVRESRYTKSMLDEGMEFTVNLPVDAGAKEILAYCGTHSFRDTDKIADMHLETVPSDTVTPPAIRQLPLTLECRVVYRQAQDPGAIPPWAMERYYASVPKDRYDYHTAYYGLIQSAYILE